MPASSAPKGSSKRAPNISKVPSRHSPRPRLGSSLRATLMRHEREYLTRALEVANGERQMAARVLGISRKTLWKKLKEYGITHAAQPDVDDAC